MSENTLKSILRKPERKPDPKDGETEKQQNENGETQQQTEGGAPEKRIKNIRFSPEALTHSRLQPPVMDTGEDALKELISGSTFIKLRSKKAYERFYYYDPELFGLCWFSRKNGGHVKSISLTSLVSVLDGKDSKGFKGSDTQRYEADLCFTVEHTGGILDLISESKDRRDIWTACLRYLMKQGKDDAQLKATKARHAWINSLFEQQDQDKDGLLSFPEAKELLGKLAPYVERASIDDQVEHVIGGKMEKKDGGCVTLDHIRESVKNLSSMRALFFLFEQYSSSSDAMSPNDLATFMEVEEEQTLTVDECAELISKHEPVPENKVAKRLTFAGFCVLSLNKFSVSVEDLGKADDTSWPINHYYIQSSHNTYLTGNQVSEPSNAQRYREVLREGARLVEVDVWSTDKNEIAIRHGDTDVQPCDPLEVFRLINEHAFEYTEYPLFVLIEMHLQSSKQQASLAQSIKDMFQARLFTREDPLFSADGLPSLEELKSRIIICSQRGTDKEAVEMDEYDEYSSFVPKKKRKTKANAGAKAKGKEVKKITIYPEWSQVVAIHHDVVPTEVDMELDPWTMVSLSEDHLLRAFDYGITDQLLHVSRHQLVRVYPSMGRVNSANFVPSLFWAAGVNFASVNFQTDDVGKHMSKFKFMSSGNTGYSRKPAFVADMKSVYSPQPEVASHASKQKSTRQLLATKPKIMNINVYSATQLSPSETWRMGRKPLHQVVDPYVHIHILGVPDDDASHTTRALDNSTLHPFWNESAKFAVYCPPLAMLQLLVLDDDLGGNNFMGQTVLPLDRVPSGYHHLQIYDERCEAIPGCFVFVKIEFSPVDADQLVKVVNVNKELVLHFDEAEKDIAKARRETFQGQQQRLKSNDLLKLTDDDEYDVFLRECNSMLEELYSLHGNVESAHAKFLLSTGCKAMTSIADAMDSVAQSIKMVSYKTSDEGGLFRIILDSDCDVPPSIRESIEAMELFSTTSSQYIEKVDEFMAKATELEKHLKKMKREILNGHATNHELVALLSSNITTFRAVPMRLSELSAIVEDELFALRRSLMRSRRSSVRCVRK
eukprot:m.16099 g.16099  ORF g.16099 m.16099 type:complete len:1061 (-) comp4566_c0_seq1:183-3365(-)